jgi:hypothetical protein
VARETDSGVATSTKIDGTSRGGGVRTSRTPVSEENMTVSPFSRAARQISRVAAMTATAAVAFVICASDTRAQTNAQAEEFTAFAVNMGTLTGGGTANLVITVNRWSSDAEREKLFSVLKEKGAEALLETVQDMRRVGTLRTPETIGYELRFAMQEPGKDGGRRVLIATDRPVSFAEARNRPISMEYPFTVIDMQLRPDGTGEGTMSLAAKFIPAGRTVLVENYDTQPVRLNRIQSRKLTK